LHEHAYQQSFYTMVFSYLWLHSDDPSHRALPPSPLVLLGSRSLDFRFWHPGIESPETLLRVSAKMLMLFQWFHGLISCYIGITNNESEANQSTSDAFVS